MKDLLVGFILGWCICFLLAPPKFVSKPTWNEGERICFSEGADVKAIQERRVYQHTVVCENNRTYRFNTRDGKFE